MKRFFVKNDNFVIIASVSDSENAFETSSIIRGSLLYLNIENGYYVISSKTERVYVKRDSLSESRSRIALLVAILINNKYIELRKFKELKELPINKENNPNAYSSYVKKRLKKI